MPDRDLYQILGVHRRATEKEILRAYRELARKYHPDRNPGDRQAEERFKDISYAKDILADKEKRALYDEFGESGLREGFNPGAYRQYRAAQAGGAGGWSGAFEDLFGVRQGGFRRAGRSPGFQEMFGTDFGGEVMEAIFGRSPASTRQRKRGKQDLRAEITIGFVDALKGVEKELSYQMPGSRQGIRTLRVRIPAGIRDGGHVRLRGQGSDGGDLVLQVHVEAHPLFWREGTDLHLNLPVTVAEAMNGAKVEVPTPDGQVSLRIPKGAQSGTKLRLRGKGVPPSGKAKPGDLIVHIQIQLPEVDPDADEEIAEAVRALEKAYSQNPRKDLRL